MFYGFCDQNKKTSKKMRVTFSSLWKYFIVFSSVFFLLYFHKQEQQNNISFNFYKTWQRKLKKK